MRFHTGTNSRASSGADSRICRRTDQSRRRKCDSGSWLQIRLRLLFRSLHGKDRRRSVWTCCCGLLRLRLLPWGAQPEIRVSERHSSRATWAVEQVQSRLPVRDTKGPRGGDARNDISLPWVNLSLLKWRSFGPHSYTSFSDFSRMRLLPFRVPQTARRWIQMSRLRSCLIPPLGHLWVSTDSQLYCTSWRAFLRLRSRRNLMSLSDWLTAWQWAERIRWVIQRITSIMPIVSDFSCAGVMIKESWRGFFTVVVAGCTEFPAPDTPPPRKGWS